MPKASAYLLGSPPSVHSILLHRSVATGEVSFGRSDIDLMVVIDPETAASGQKMASLYRTVRRARILNPALNHLDVFDPGGLADLARMDTFWGSIERRTARLLRGEPVEIPLAPVEPNHALARFLLWAEWFFAIAVRQRNRRNFWRSRSARPASSSSWRTVCTVRVCPSCASSPSHSSSKQLWRRSGCGGGSLCCRMPALLFRRMLSRRGRFPARRSCCTRAFTSRTLFSGGCCRRSLWIWA
jgi:hypothetical protein